MNDTATGTCYVRVGGIMGVASSAVEEVRKRVSITIATPELCIAG